MEIYQAKGNTFYIDTGMTYIPFYKMDDQQIIMLDSGWAEGERAGIEALLVKNKLRVAGIINSHAHNDHIGNNAYFKKKYHCVIAMSEYEALVCSSPINLKFYYGNLSLSTLEKHFGELVCDTDILIPENQDQIYVCGVKFKIIHTPGHSTAHICIITPDDVAYLGDALIGEEVMAGAKMPYALILREDLQSKEKLFSLTCSQYIVAHRGLYNQQMLKKLIGDNIAFYKKRAESVYSVITTGATMGQIMKAIIQNFGIRVQTVYKYAFIERMLRSYLEYLEEIGKIELKIEGEFLIYVKRTIP